MKVEFPSRSEGLGPGLRPDIFPLWIPRPCSAGLLTPSEITVSNTGALVVTLVSQLWYLLTVCRKRY